MFTKVSWAMFRVLVVFGALYLAQLGVTSDFDSREVVVQVVVFVVHSLVEAFTLAWTAERAELEAGRVHYAAALATACLGAAFIGVDWTPRGSSVERSEYTPAFEALARAHPDPMRPAR